jgi:hypothetical protein
VRCRVEGLQKIVENRRESRKSSIDESYVKQPLVLEAVLLVGGGMVERVRTFIIKSPLLKINANHRVFLEQG